LIAAIFSLVSKIITLTFKSPIAFKTILQQYSV
jgi:hypothetical protein